MAIVFLEIFGRSKRFPIFAKSTDSKLMIRQSFSRFTQKDFMVEGSHKKSISRDVQMRCIPDPLGKQWKTPADLKNAGKEEHPKII